jgi:hypothetical protein
MASKNGSSNKYNSEFKFQKDIKFNSKPLIAIQQDNKITRYKHRITIQMNFILRWQIN